MTNPDTTTEPQANPAEATVPPQGDGGDAGAGENAALDALVEAETERDTLLVENAALQAALKETSAERDALRAEVNAAKAAPPAAKAVPRERTAKAKALRPKEYERPAPDTLLSLIGEAAQVRVIACFNGREVLGVPPLAIEGARGWRVTAVGLVLAIEQWLVSCEAPGGIEIDGWALEIDGDVLGWRDRSDVLRFGLGQTMNLAGDVVF